MDEPLDPPSPAFAYKAAKYGLWLPLFIIFSASCLAHFGLADANMSEKMTLLQTIASLIVIGLAATAMVLAILALVAIPRLGTGGLLIPGIGGVVTSAIALLLLVEICFPEPLSVTMSKEMTGVWTSSFVVPGEGTASAKLELAADGKAHWNIVFGDKPHDVRGTWHVESHPLVLEIVPDRSAATTFPSDSLTWEIGEVTEKEMELTPIHAGPATLTETYERTAR